MEKYLITIIVLIIFSIALILYLRVSDRVREISEAQSKQGYQETGDDSADYDGVTRSLNSKLNINKVDSSDPLFHLKSSDFTLLE